MKSREIRNYLSSSPLTCLPNHSSSSSSSPSSSPSSLLLPLPLPSSSSSSSSPSSPLLLSHLPSPTPPSPPSPLLLLLLSLSQAEKSNPPLEEGDQLLYINSKPVTHCRHEEVIGMIRASHDQTPCDLILIVKPKDLSRTNPIVR